MLTASGLRSGACAHAHDALAHDALARACAM